MSTKQELLDSAADSWLGGGDPVATRRERRQRRAIERGLRPPPGMHRVPIEQVVHSVSADDVILPQDTAVLLDRVLLLAQLPTATPSRVRRSVAMAAQGMDARDIGAHLRHSLRTTQRHLRWARQHARPIGDISWAAVVLALLDLDEWATVENQPEVIDMNEQQLKNELKLIQCDLLDEIPSAREARFAELITDAAGDVRYATISVPYGSLDRCQMLLIANFDHEVQSWSGYAYKHDPKTRDGEVSDPECLNGRTDTASAALLHAQADADMWLQNEDGEKEADVDSWGES